MSADHLATEIAEQPAILARIAATRFDAVVTPRVCITGSGDSHCAAELAAWAWRARGRDAVAFRPLELARYRHTTLDDDATVVAISASGRTRRVLEAVRVARARGASVAAITDDPDSPIAREADRVWPLGASPAAALSTTDYTGAEAAGYVGYHHDVPQTKTFSASVAVALLAAGMPLSDLVGRADAALTRARSWSTGVGPGLAAARRTVFVGSGPLAPVARYAAYKWCEFVRDGYAQETEEYCHTHYFLTEPGTTVVFLVADRLGAERVREIAPVLTGEIGASVQAIVVGDDVDPGVADALRLASTDEPGWRPLLAALAVQWLAHAMATAAGLSTATFRGGLDPERYVAGSARAIRGSRVVPPDELLGES